MIGPIFPTMVRRHRARRGSESTGSLFVYSYYKRAADVRIGRKPLGESPFAATSCSSLGPRVEPRRSPLPQFWRNEAAGGGPPAARSGATSGRPSWAFIRFDDAGLLKRPGRTADSISE